MLREGGGLGRGKPELLHKLKNLITITINYLQAAIFFLHFFGQKLLDVKIFK